MGTVASLAVATHRSAADAQVRRRVAACVAAELLDADKRFSRYRHGSELQRLRRGEGAPVSDHMAQVIADCASLERRSGGAFRPRDAAGGFDPTGYVKGWAMDRAVAAAVAVGAEDVCLNVGGDVKVVGRASARRPWRVAVRHPVSGLQLLAVVQPPEADAPMSVATSGTYERGEHLWLTDGAAAPPGPPLAVTVFGGEAGEVDACATAVWVRAREQGVGAGLALLAAWPGVAGIVAAAGRGGRWYIRAGDGAAAYLVAPVQTVAELPR